MKNLSFLALTTLLFAACQSSPDDLATPSGSTRVAERSAQTKTITGDIQGTPDPDAPPTLCTGDLPGLAAADYFLDGQTLHLGNLDGVLSRLHHENCDLSFATMLLTTSVSGQIVAANGDKIYYTGDDVVNVFNLLTASGTTGSIIGTWTIAGGTGRFADATGSVTIDGLVDFTNFSFSVAVDGTITY